MTFCKMACIAYAFILAKTNNLVLSWMLAKEILSNCKAVIGAAIIHNQQIKRLIGLSKY